MASDGCDYQESTDDFIVRVRGLPWSAKEAEIRQFFSGCEEIRGIYFTYTREGRPTGEAYIECGSTQDVELALLKHREHMKDRYIEVFEAKRAEMEYVLKRSGKPDFSSSSSELDVVVRLRGLPFGCTKEDICNFCSGMEIAPDGIVWATDGSGRVTGEAYVRFMDKETTERALDKHMQNIGHRYIEVFRSTVDELTRVQRRGGIPPQGARAAADQNFDSDYYDYTDGGMGRGYGYPPVAKPYSLLDLPVLPPANRFEARHQGFDYSARQNGGDMYNMYSNRVPPMLRGLPSLFDEDIYSGGGGGAPRGRRDGGGGAPRGSGRFRDRSPIGGGRPGGFFGGPRPSAVGRVTGHVVHMRGLPYKATATDIIEFFHPIKVLNVNVSFDERSGRPMGEADVEFNSHEEALQAMGKNKEHMGERYVELFLNSTPRASSMYNNMPTEEEQYQASLVRYPNLGAYTSFSN